MPTKIDYIRQNEFSFNFGRPFKFSGFQTIAGDKATTPINGSYNIDDKAIPLLSGIPVDPLLADWLDIALAVYLADRLSPRDNPNNQHSGVRSRDVRLQIPVRELSVWVQPNVCASLHNVLGFFTEDGWHLDFIPYEGKKRSSETQGMLFAPPPTLPVRVALFSGGLDSFAGAIQQLSEFPEHSFIFVSGVTNNRQRAAQHNQIAAIKNTRHHVHHIPISYKLTQSYTKRREEISQRSRGFLFLTLGGVTAITANSKELYLYENGIGAINLPYNASQVGTSNTRAVNPRSLLLMEEFITNLLGISFKIHNPFLFQTKAEMCRYPMIKSFGRSIAQTFSCDGFPIRQKNKPQCGSCTSCLLRRYALQSAGLTTFDASDTYLRDLLSPGFAGNTNHLFGLQAMEWQVQVITSCLKSQNPWFDLSQKFTELQTISVKLWLSTGRPLVDIVDIQQDFLRLYTQYVTEWHEFSAHKLLITQLQAA